MSSVVNQDRIDALRNLLGDTELDERLIGLIRGGPGTEGSAAQQLFSPFRVRMATGEAQPFRENPQENTLRNFMQELNRLIAEPVTK